MDLYNILSEDTLNDIFKKLNMEIGSFHIYMSSIDKNKCKDIFINKNIITLNKDAMVNNDIILELAKDVIYDAVLITFTMFYLKDENNIQYSNFIINRIVHEVEEDLENTYLNTSVVINYSNLISMIFDMFAYLKDSIKSSLKNDLDICGLFYISEKHILDGNYIYSHTNNTFKTLQVKR